MLKGAQVEENVYRIVAGWLFKYHNNVIKITQ